MIGENVSQFSSLKFLYFICCFNIQNRASGYAVCQKWYGAFISASMKQSRGAFISASMKQSRNAQTHRIVTKNITKKRGDRIYFACRSHRLTKLSESWSGGRLLTPRHLVSLVSKLPFCFCV